MKRESCRPAKHEVCVEFEGRSFSASYYLGDGLVTVSSVTFGETSAMAGAAPEVTAQVLFRELLQAAKRRGLL